MSMSLRESAPLTLPRERRVPDHVTTWGPDARELAAIAGIHCQPWQSLVLDDMLGERADGKWAARESGLTVPRQNGKALDVSTPILTANRGWVSMADVQVGDQVFHPAGHPVYVTRTSETLLGHDCYRVTTTDGRSVIADADHLWTVADKRRGKSQGSRGRRVRTFQIRTLTTHEMFIEGVSRYDAGGRTSVTDGKPYATNEYRFVLPTQEPIKNDDVELPVDPYLLGAWLGDGTSSSACLTSHVDDAPHWLAEIERAGYTPTLQRGRRPTVRQIGITSPGPGKLSRCLAAKLRALGVLGDKHVPSAYLSAGPAQREALLQGLLDTDGTIEAKRGQVEFCSTSRALADGALFLARSLGWRATLRVHRAILAGCDYGPKYRVCFTPVRSDPFVPFRLERKAARIRPEDGGKGRTTLSVCEVTPVPSVPVRCVTVDSPDGLYLAGHGLLPTHNSVVAVIRVLAGLFVLDEELIVYTAHLVDTAEKIFDRVVRAIEDTPDLQRRGWKPSFGRGSKGLKVYNPTQELVIRARSRESVRGYSADVIILDEAQLGLDEDDMAALGPTQRARPNPQTILMGTPPLQAGTYWGAVRKRALAGDPRMAWDEWSPPQGYDRDDRAVWRSTNPAHGILIDDEAIEHDRKTLGSKFDAEAVGAWPAEKEDAGWEVFTEKAYRDADDLDSVIDGPVAFGIEASHDLSHLAIGAAGRRVDGLRHLEPLDYFPADTGKLVGWLKKRIEKWHPVAVVIDPAGPAGYLIPEVEKHCGIEVMKPLGRDVAAACGSVYVGVCGSEPEARDVRLRVPDGPLGQTLTAAARGAVWRNRGDAKVFDRRAEGPDVSLLMALALADHGVTHAPAAQPFFASWR